jgi:hypothetical protein
MFRCTVFMAVTAGSGDMDPRTGGTTGAALTLIGRVSNKGVQGQVGVQV